MQILIIPVLLFLMYMLLLRPQQQRVRRQQQLISTIGIGDQVVTAGGLIGRVVEADDERVWLEVADEVVVELLRMYVIRRLEESPSTPDEEADPDLEGDFEPDLGDAESEATEPDQVEATDPGPAEEAKPAGGLDAQTATPHAGPDHTTGAGSAPPTLPTTTTAQGGPEPDPH